MPFKSEKQRRFMYARHPKIAKRWSAEEKQNNPMPEKKRETREEALVRIKREGAGVPLYARKRKPKPKLKPKPKPSWYEKYNPFAKLAKGPLAPPKKKDK